MQTLFNLCVNKIANIMIEDVQNKKETLDLSWLDSYVLNSINTTIISKLTSENDILKSKLTITRKMLSISLRQASRQQLLYNDLMREIEERDGNFNFLVNMINTVISIDNKNDDNSSNTSPSSLLSEEEHNTLNDNIFDI